MYAVTQDRNWYAKIGTGYAAAKFGMTLITYGISGELKDDGVAANTLWPRTAIQTSAVKNLLGGDEAMKKSRTEEIMADAAYEILTSDAKTTTGQTFMDDFVLGSVGIQDLSKYKMADVPDWNLVMDFMS